ncbi:Uncharacterised protein [Bacteroides heparinolyticus]|uniref:Uncharacterized protein n=1 Tax=Prevotella heparinolytica TaxID=28113 RepID=A0A449I6N0_9BACE|nr:Uncharacterised protein [Bacteroides heparinolyticus]
MDALCQLLVQYYWKQKHGADVVGQIWTQAQFPEDALMAYRRIYCGGSSDKLYEELYDYATRMVTYDIDVIRNHVKRRQKDMLRSCSRWVMDIIR